MSALLARDLAGQQAIVLSLPRLRSGQSYQAMAALPTARRGVIPSGPLLIDRDDAFGLAHRTLDTGHGSELYVRPRAVELPEIAGQPGPLRGRPAVGHHHGRNAGLPCAA